MSATLCPGWIGHRVVVNPAGGYLISTLAKTSWEELETTAQSGICDCPPGCHAFYPFGKTGRYRTLFMDDFGTFPACSAHSSAPPLSQRLSNPCRMTLRYHKTAVDKCHFLFIFD